MCKCRHRQPGEICPSVGRGEAGQEAKVEHWLHAPTVSCYAMFLICTQIVAKNAQVGCSANRAVRPA